MSAGDPSLDPPITPGGTTEAARPVRAFKPRRVRSTSPLRRLGWSMAGWIGMFLIRGIRAGLRLRFHGDDELRGFEAAERPFVLAFWHHGLLLMPYVYRGQRVAVMASQSDAGEWLTAVLSHFGIRSVRGSNSRGGLAALHELVRLGRGGWDIAVAPDGPRGPAGEVKPGVLAVASAVGCPIVPIAWSVRRCWRLASWDRMVVPIPLGVAHFVIGPSFTVERRDDFAAVALDLARRLNEVEAAARAAAGVEESQCAA
ncbi:MAG: lysophospholipid acyltransferase family protein [Acidobacteriota bacterium]